MRPTDIYPQQLIDELLRVVKIDRNWVTWERGPDQLYKAKTEHQTWLRRTWSDGGDAFSMLAASRWLIDGPKVFRPTKEQCAALERIDVNLMLEEYSQPYPALLVVLDYPPFSSVLCFKDLFHADQGCGDHLLICSLHSAGHEHDVTTTVATTTEVVERSLEKFDESCAVDAPTAAKALRVACNSCLALSHYGCHLDYLFPKEIVRDRDMAREQSERGQRARSRISLAVEVASFDNEVVLHRTERIKSIPGEPTGRQLPPHWRSGHWAMQPHGPSNSLRKRILRPPVMVRSDLFVGDAADSATTYRTTKEPKHDSRATQPIS